MTPGSDVAELELLLACARPRLTPADRERAARAIRHGIDWAVVLRAARAHRLVPLLHTHVGAGGVDAPALIAQALRTDAAGIAQHSLRLAAELGALMQACARAGIAVVPLKGPAATEFVYGSIALRHVRDLDVLIDEASFPAVLGILKGRGYDVPPWLRPDPAVHGHFHAVSVRHPDGMTLDLHTALLPPRGRRRWTLEALAGRLEERAFMGVPLASLSSEDVFVYLCEHGCGHGWLRLDWLALAAELARRHVRAGEPLEESMQFFDARRRVAATLALAATLLGPTGLDVGTDRDARLATALMMRRFRGPRGLGAAASLFEILAYQLLTDGGASARMHRLRVTFGETTPADSRAATPPRSRPAALYQRYTGLIRRQWSPGKKTPR